MRIVARSVAVASGAALLSAFLLTGCVTVDTSGFLEPSMRPTTEAPTTTPPAEAPSPSPTPEPEPASTLPVVVEPAAGDCQLDPSDYVVTFVVTADNDSAPIEITYPGFALGADAPEARSMTVVGPVVTVLGNSSCSSGPESEPWPFTATSSADGSLSCAAFFGGKRINGESDYLEGADRDLSVDCTSHPGM